jgi:hypothetical protein
MSKKKRFTEPLREWTIYYLEKRGHPDLAWKLRFLHWSRGPFRLQSTRFKENLITALVVPPYPPDDPYDHVMLDMVVDVLAPNPDPDFQVGG